MRTEDVARATGASYRQLDYWSRIGALVPTEAEAKGSGSRRGYSDNDMRVAKVLAAASDLGVHGDPFRRLGQRLQQLDRAEWERFAWVTPDGDVIVGGGPPEPVVVMVDLMRLSALDAELLAEVAASA